MAFAAICRLTLISSTFGLIKQKQALEVPLVKDEMPFIPSGNMV
jgi:hypothetical protein